MVVLRDHNHFIRTETAFERNPLTISAKRNSTHTHRVHKCIHISYRFKLIQKLKQIKLKTKTKLTCRRRVSGLSRRKPTKHDQKGEGQNQHVLTHWLHFVYDHHMETPSQENWFLSEESVGYFFDCWALESECGGRKRRMRQRKGREKRERKAVIKRKKARG